MRKLRIMLAIALDGFSLRRESPPALI